MTSEYTKSYTGFMKNPSIMVEYRDDKDDLMLNVMFDGETIWLTQDEIALLFDTSRSNVNQHIKTIYKDEELEKSTTCKKFLQVGDNGKRYYIQRYNLDMIISVGYKVRSKTATRFRKWATNVISERITGNYVNLAQEEALRLLTRVQVDDSTTSLVGVATTKHKVRNEESFLDAGDRGMYHSSRDEVERNRHIPDGKLYDYIGSAELGMHVYRLTQTAEAFNVDAKAGYIHDQEEAEAIHNNISEYTRAMSHKVHQQYPEDLPKAQNIEIIKAKNRALLKRHKPAGESPSQEKLAF